MALGEGVAVRTRRDREGEMREGTSTDRLASNPRPYCQPSGRGCQLRNHRALPAVVKTNPRQLASLVGVHIAEELGHRSVVGLFSVVDGFTVVSGIDERLDDGRMVGIERLAQCFREIAGRARTHGA